LSKVTRYRPFAGFAHEIGVTPNKIFYTLSNARHTLYNTEISDAAPAFRHSITCCRWLRPAYVPAAPLRFNSSIIQRSILLIDFFHDGLIYTSADVFISAVICNHYRLMIGVRCNEYEPSTRQLVYCMNERQALHETWTSRAW